LIFDEVTEKISWLLFYGPQCSGPKMLFSAWLTLTFRRLDRVWVVVKVTVMVRAVVLEWWPKHW